MKRYQLVHGRGRDNWKEMEEFPDGSYVLFDEAQAELAQRDAEIGRLRSMIQKLAHVAMPFVEMDREGCNLDEVALTRGTASDMTILTTGDFRRLAKVIKEAESWSGSEVQLEPSSGVSSVPSSATATAEIAATEKATLGDGLPDAPQCLPTEQTHHSDGNQFPPLPPNARRIVEGDVPQEGDLLWLPGRKVWETRAFPRDPFSSSILNRREYCRYLAPDPLLTAEERVGEDLERNCTTCFYTNRLEGAEPCRWCLKETHEQRSLYPAWCPQAGAAGPMDDINSEAAPETDGTTEADLESRIEALEVSVQGIKDFNAMHMPDIRSANDVEQRFLALIGRIKELEAKVERIISAVDAHSSVPKLFNVHLGPVDVNWLRTGKEG